MLRTWTNRSTPDSNKLRKKNPLLFTNKNEENNQMEKGYTSDEAIKI
jgi:hypothetical protein